MVGPDAKLIRLVTQLAPDMIDGYILKKKADFEKTHNLN